MGKTPKKSEYVSEGIPIIKFRSLTGNGINWNKVERVKKDFYERNKSKIVQEGDIILTSSAHNPEYIGRKIDLIKNIPKDFDKVMFVGEVMVIRPDKNKIIPEYLYYYLKSEFGRLQIRREITGQTAHLYSEEVEEIKVIFPQDKKIQEKIINPIKKDIETKIDSLEKAKTKLMGLDSKVMEMLGLRLSEFKKENLKQ